MPYVYEGEDTVRVKGQRYSKGSTTDDESVKGKKDWREVSDDEAADIASERPGTFKDAQPDAWQKKFGEVTEWVGHASVSAPLNRVIGDNEAPFGPPTGTITTKQAVMRAAENSNERNAFGDHEWLPEDAEARNLADSTSGKVQAAQAEQSGKLEKVTEEILSSGDESSGDESKSEKQNRGGRQPRQSSQGQSSS
jgi:hypothetical protein